MYCAGTEAGDRSNLYANNLAISGAGVGSPVGGSIVLDGEGDYVEVPNWKGISGNHARTVSAWIKTDIQHNSGRYDMAISSWGSNTSMKKWTFRTQKSNGRHGTIRVEVNGGAIVGSTYVTDDHWHHVAVVVPDGATLLEELVLYVDGRREKISFVSQNIQFNTDSAANVMIGKDHSNRHFQGNIDNLAFFDLALSSEQVLGLYNGQNLSVSIDSSLVDAGTPGDYLVNYSSTDAANRVGTGTRTVQVVDFTPSHCYHR